MAVTTMVHVRVDEDIKKKASEALAAMGLTVSAAVKMLLLRIAADQALPFDMRVPNAETRAAMAEADAMARAFLAVGDETSDGSSERAPR